MKAGADAVVRLSEEAARAPTSRSSGGIDVPVVLGSRSTYTLGALGGLEGRKLQAGDELPVGKGTRRRKEGATVAGSAAARATARRSNCACCPGSTGTGSPRRRASISSTMPGRWRRRRTASATASRAAAPLEFVPREQPFGAGSDPSNIVDACYPYGSIQVPGGTEPIVLHRDAVSGGGYFMVGTVISATWI